MYRLYGLLLGILVLFWTGPVYASGDSGCYPRWTIKHTNDDGCSSTALLGPGNDTRVNLLMLLHDQHKDVGGTALFDSYDSIEIRRGEAEPFDFLVFALALGTPLERANEQVLADQERAAAAWGPTGSFWGTRCMTNSTGGTEFIAALGKTKKVPVDERATLIAVRTMLQPDCVGGGEARAMVEQGLMQIKSKQGRHFAIYLRGAASFYDGDYPNANIAFAALGKTDVPWLADTAKYMTGRTALNEALEGAFNQYGYLENDGANKAALEVSESAFLGYLKDYPAGLHSASARGLLRKVYWLGQRRDKLTAAYVQQFASGAVDGNVTLVDLVQEIDNKLLYQLDPTMVSDPMLLAVLDLKAMRHDGDPKTRDHEITRVALDAQRPLFVGHEALFDYVRAVHAFFVADDPVEVLRLIPTSERGSGYLGYSRQLLRALAMDALGDPKARAMLFEVVGGSSQPMQRGTAELALAMHDERHNSTDNVFAANSVITDPDIREILLRYHAGPSLLRMRSGLANVPEHERYAALYTLLYKELTRGAYADFVRDLRLVPDDAKLIGYDDYRTPPYTHLGIFKWAGSKDFACPGIGAVADALSRAPKDASSLLCLGEFVRLNGLDPNYGVVHYLDETPPATELAGTPSLFPGKRYSRLDGYKAVIADRKSGADNKAYALYRAVHCFAPSASNDCDETDIPLAQRRAWFQQLKANFASSVWAKRAKYYW